MTAATHDPKALLLTQEEVARRLKVSVQTVKRCRVAVRCDGAVRPMSGWIKLGREYRIAEADVIDWIADADPA